jgi:uncharacterized Zn-binding protein involved in type VI secretion
MRTRILAPAVVVIGIGGLGAAAAQTSGVVTQGSPDAMIEGKPAARVGDQTTKGGPVVEGSPNVFFNGRPAAIVGGKGGCGVIVGGSGSVFINGKPAAVAGSSTDCKGR